MTHLFLGDNGGFKYDATDQSFVNIVSTYYFALIYQLYEIKNEEIYSNINKYLLSIQNEYGMTPLYENNDFTLQSVLYGLYLLSIVCGV